MDDTTAVLTDRARGCPAHARLLACAAVCVHKASGGPSSPSPTSRARGGEAGLSSVMPSADECRDQIARCRRSELTCRRRGRVHLAEGWRSERRRNEAILEFVLASQGPPRDDEAERAANIFYAHQLDSLVRDCFARIDRRVLDDSSLWEPDDATPSVLGHARRHIRYLWKLDGLGLLALSDAERKKLARAEEEIRGLDERIAAEEMRNREAEQRHREVLARARARLDRSSRSTLAVAPRPPRQVGAHGRAPRPRATASNASVHSAARGSGPRLPADAPGDPDEDAVAADPQSAARRATVAGGCASVETVAKATAATPAQEAAR